MSKICWPKNVLEEWDCPFHLMFGAMDVCYDLPTAFGLWLEWRLEHGPEETSLCSAWTVWMILSASTRSWGGYWNLLLGLMCLFLGRWGWLVRTAFVNLLFLFLVGRGCAGEFMLLCCAAQIGHLHVIIWFLQIGWHWVHSRWKNSFRIEEIYADTSIPHVDAKVAQALSKGGAVWTRRRGACTCNQGKIN